MGIFGQKIRVTISVGIAFTQWPDHLKERLSLIEAADTRLYEAKRAGRNCCKFEDALPQAA
jgi:GGDEF domain-containing protein